MMNRLSRQMDSVTVAVAVADSKEIIFSEFAGGIVYIPAGSSITLLTWYVAPEPGGTYLAAYDQDGVQVTQTVAAGNAYEIKSSLYAARGLKAVGDAAGTMDVSLKA